MSLFLATSRSFWLPGLPNIRANPEMTIGSWLGEAAYYVTKLDSSSSFTLSFPELKDAVKLFAITADRAALGCCESIASISSVAGAPRSVAWLLIKLYYSAFFAAHANMRNLGYSCMNLDAVDAAKIFDTARLNGVSGAVAKINSGLYYAYLNTAASEITFSSVTASGSHEALWASYKRFLSSLQQSAGSIVTIPVERDKFVGVIVALQGSLSLKGSNGGNWLSRVRNQVQYRQGYGAWFPHGLQKAVSKPLVTNVDKLFKGDPDDIELRVAVDNIDEEVLTFFNSALFLSSCARGMVLDIAARSSEKFSVTRQGSVGFLRQMRLH